MFITFFAEHFPNDDPGVFLQSGEIVQDACSSLIVGAFSMQLWFFSKLEPRSSPHPSGNELTTSIILWNQFYTAMVFISTWLPPQLISRRLTTHLASGSPTQHTHVDFQQRLTRSRQQNKKYNFLTNHNKSSITPASSYEIFSNPLTTNALVWTEGSNFLLRFSLNQAPPIH